MTNKKFFAPLLVICALSGCATVRHPVPPELVTKAQLGKLDDVRVMMGAHNTKLQENLLFSLKQEAPGDFPVGPDGVKVYPILAISGGGANGAYGAGLLNGWSKEGSRPVFKVVTGVSTGALIAPFAFLGKDYDEELKKCYTTLSTKDVAARKLPGTMILGNSFLSNAPLERTIGKIADKHILAKIAAEHLKGRRLFVGTADLDAERFVIWDMGAIALRGDTELFRKVIVASAAIPGVFPPSIFRVEADGKPYDEMHVDGGTITQVLITYKLLEGMESIAKQLNIEKSKVKGRLYIIRNGYMSPVYKKVDNSLAAIAGRSFEVLIDAQGVGDSYRIYLFSKEAGNDYNLAYIPGDFVQAPREMFDPVDMTRLFNRGYEDAAGGYKWHKEPPGDVDMKTIEYIKGRITDPMPMAVKAEVDEKRQLPDTAYDSVHNQYVAAMVADYFARKLTIDANEERVIVITSADLGMPDADFVYGLADPKNAISVMSTARLKDRDAALKEAIYQFGRSRGLEDCTNKKCVMHPVASAADINLKNARFCVDCRMKLEQKYRVPIVKKKLQDLF